MTPSEKINLLIVAGPTGSGKSNLAIKLGQDLPGEIVNADSVQVYREADIGSAKASLAEQSQVKHHLIDIVNPDQDFNTARFVQFADMALTEVASRNSQPILVGGSTLYLTHLLHGLSSLPSADKELRAELNSLSNLELVKKLQEVDPATLQKVHINDRVRLVRALEASILLNDSASVITKSHSYDTLRYNALIVVIVWEREKLYQRIHKRTQAMLEAGLVKETEGLRRRFGDGVKVLQSLGYKECLRFLNGEISSSDLEKEIAQNTRRYAKRQMTYWRNEPDKRGWLRAGPQKKSLSDCGLDGNLDQLRELEGFSVCDLNYREFFSHVQSRFKTGVKGIEVMYVSAKIFAG